MERILKIKGSNDEHQKHITRLDNAISFYTIFKECGIEADTKKQRLDTRRNVAKILNFFKEQNFISDYEFVKNLDGNFSVRIFF